MDFVHPDGCHVPVLLPSRSVAILTGESRYLWTHGITPRKSDVVTALELGEGVTGEQRLTLLKRGTRTSFTFRTVRHMPCDCSMNANSIYFRTTNYSCIFSFYCGSS